MQPTASRSIQPRGQTPATATMAPWRPSLGFIPQTRPGQYEVILDAQGQGHVVARLYRKALAPGVAGVQQVATVGGGRMADPTKAIDAAKAKGCHVVDPATEIAAFGGYSALVVSYPVKGGRSYCYGWERPIEGVQDAVDIDLDARVTARKDITRRTIGDAHPRYVAALKAKALADYTSLVRNPSAAAAANIENLRNLMAGMGWAPPVDRRAPAVQVQVSAQPAPAPLPAAPTVTESDAEKTMAAELAALRAELAALRSAKAPAEPPPSRPAPPPTIPAAWEPEEEDLDDGAPPPRLP